MVKKVNDPLEFSLISSNKYQTFLFIIISASFTLILRTVFLAVTVEVKGPYEYLTLEEYPLMIVSKLIFFNLNIK